MRRSRINVMATVPVRRKQIKDPEDKETDLSNVVFDRIVSNNETTKMPVSPDKDTKDIQFETIYMPMIKLEKDEKPELTNLVFNETNDNEEAMKIMESHGKDTKEILFEAINCPEVIKHEVKIELEEPASSTSQILDIFEKNDNEELRSSCESTERIIKEEEIEDIGENSPNQHNTYSQYDVAPIFEETMRESYNFDSAQIRHSARLSKQAQAIEAARKLDEEKRQFASSCENKQDDGGRFTMYDLIRSNSAKKMFKKSDEPLSVTQRESSVVSKIPMEDNEEEENCDSMAEPRNKIISDNRLLGVKNCEVNEETRKNKRSSARKNIYVYENSSGFYKTRRHARDWSKSETLKFYKALNTVGTDFSLMQSLFPDRTRGEIRDKYKKEDKNNRECVEKVLSEHQEFDIDSLKEDFAARQVEEPNPKKARKDRRKKKTSRCVTTTLSIDELNRELYKPEAFTESTIVETNKCREATPLSEDDNDDSSKLESDDSSYESPSDMEAYQIKPTKSGRGNKV